MSVDSGTEKLATVAAAEGVYSPPKPAKLSLGCSAFGGVFKPMPLEECVAILRSAFKAGISLLDTAPWYKSSETVVGNCLQQLAKEGFARSSFCLNTKCGRYTTGQMFDFSAARVTQSVHDSLRKLQTSYIDTIQIHDCEFGDEDQIVNETLPALDLLRQAGKVRRIGVTSYDMRTLRRIIERSDIRIDSALVYCRYALNDRSLVEHDTDSESFLSFLRRRQIEFIYASPIAMGLLCNRPPPVWHPASDNLKARTVAANEFAEQRGFNLARLAIGYVLQQADIPTTLVSCTSLDIMQANIEVLHGGLTPEETAILDVIVQKFFPQSEHWVGVEIAKLKAKELHKKQQQQQAQSKGEPKAAEGALAKDEYKAAVHEEKGACVAEQKTD